MTWTVAPPAPRRQSVPAALAPLAVIALVAVTATVLSHGLGLGLVSTSFVKTLGKTLCLCLAAVAMDVVWGYTGILSLGHMAFFAIGGYAVGQWIMTARTTALVEASLAAQPLPPTPQEVTDAVAAQIFGVVGGDAFPWLWIGAHSLALQLLAVVLVPGLLALAFGWLAFRSRVTGVYLSILTQAMTLALSLWLFQNDSGLRGNNGLSGLQNVPGLEPLGQDVASIIFLWASALALALGFLLFGWLTSGRRGALLRAVRDDESRLRFLGHGVEGIKLVVFVLTAVVCAVAGALYYPQAGIVNPGELAPLASIYLAVWVALGGRGRLYGAALGAAAVSLLSSWLTGGGAPDIPLGFATFRWTDWWTVVLGLGFVAVTLLAPQGLGGLLDRLPVPPRQGDWGPDDGARRREEGEE